MFSRIFATVLLGALVLSAQDKGTPTSTPGAILVPQTPPFKELQTYLNLSDGQVDALRNVQSQKDQAQQAIWKQISDKQTELYQLLQAGSTDYVHIGQLMVDSNNLQKQAYPGPVEPYRSQALAVLNAQQKPKLQALTDALALNNTAYQAVSLNLVDGPAYPIIYAATDGSRGTPPVAAPALPVLNVLPAKQ